MSVLHRLPSGLTFVGKNDTAIKGAKTYRIEDAKGHIFSKSDDFILAPPSAKAKKNNYIYTESCEDVTVLFICSSFLVITTQFSVFRCL